MMKAEALRIVILLAPGNRLGIDVDADIKPIEAPAAEIVIAQPMRPAPAARADVEDTRFALARPSLNANIQKSRACIRKWT